MPIGYSPPRQQLPRLHVLNMLARQGRAEVEVVWVVLLKMRKWGKARAYILMGPHTVMVGGMHTRMITAMGSRMKRVLKLSRLPSIGMHTPFMYLYNISTCTQIHSYEENSRHQLISCHPTYASAEYICVYTDT